jgi:predicted dehydrogenase
VALIGCGRIGASLENDPLRAKPCTHAGAYAAHPRTKLVACVDIDRERLAAVGKTYRIRHRFTDYETMLAQVRPDIVSIAAWTEFHAPMVVAAAEAGVRGIYCEKPLAANLAEAKRAMAAVRRAGAKMVVGHERRWGAHFITAKRLVDSGELGPLRTIVGYTLSGAWPRISRRKYGGGASFHDGTHMTDLFRYFAGEARSVMALEERPYGAGAVENATWSMFSFDHGVKAFMVGGNSRDYFHFELDIQTERGRILIGNNGQQLFTADTSKQFSGFRELQPAPWPAPDASTNPFVGGVQDLIDQIETDAPSLSSGVDGYKAMEMIFAIYRSASRDGAAVSFPLR